MHLPWQIQSHVAPGPNLLGQTPQNDCCACQLHTRPYHWHVSSHSWHCTQLPCWGYNPTLHNVGAMPATHSAPSTQAMRHTLPSITGSVTSLTAMPCTSPTLSNTSFCRTSSPNLAPSLISSHACPLALFPATPRLWWVLQLSYVLMVPRILEWQQVVQACTIQHFAGRNILKPHQHQCSWVCNPAYLYAWLLPSRSQSQGWPPNPHPVTSRVWQHSRRRLAEEVLPSALLDVPWRALTHLEAITLLINNNGYHF